MENEKNELRLFHKFNNKEERKYRRISYHHERSKESYKKNTEDMIEITREQLEKMGEKFKC